MGVRLPRAPSFVAKAGRFDDWQVGERALFRSPKVAAPIVNRGAYVTDFSIEQISRRGFGGIIDARGRDNRTQFWLFCALVFGPLLVAQMIVQIGLTFPSLDQLKPRSPGDAQAFARTFDAEIKGMVTSIYISIGIYLLGTLLLLTAAARRLHDRARSGWWALILPFGVFMTGLGQARRTAAMVERMPQIMAEMERHPPTPAEMLSFPAEQFSAVGGPNWPAIVGGLILLWLLIELARAGAAGPNRFGPAPG